MNSPLVSIIIPAFNAERFLAETLRSVIEQTYANWELLVVNDGSTDRTELITKTFEARDLRIKSIFQNNVGVAEARNRGFRDSGGEFISFLDADDLWLPENLSRKVEYLLQRKEIGLVHSRVAVIDEFSQKTGLELSGAEGKILDRMLLWKGSTINAPSSTLTRRSVINEIGLFDKRLSTAADQEFFFRVAARYPIGRINDVLSFYRIHTSNMHKNIKVMERDHIQAFDCACENGFFKSELFRRKCYANLYVILAGSWWTDGRNRKRGLYFIMKAIFIYPLIFRELLIKFFRRLLSDKKEIANV